MINVGVIGYGYWGPNLVRNLMASKETRVVSVCDRSEERLRTVAALHPSVHVTQDAAELLGSAIDAVVIATPVDTHFELAMAALKAGKHVLVEKPIATSRDQARRLIDEAAIRDLILLVDHTFVYTGAVRKMREIVQSEQFGNVQYFDSTRINLGLFQQDVNVLWDLAVHDLSIMNYVIDQVPVAVSATGFSHIPGQPNNIAFLTLYFDSMIAHINVNWLSPVKVRRTLIGGAKQMIVYDDLEATEKLKVYDKGIVVTETPEDVRRLLISYRTGDLWSPNVGEVEALSTEVAHFAACIDRKEKPLTGGEVGLALVSILEAANESLKLRGSPVEIRAL